MWKFCKIGFEGNCSIFGVNIFDFDWHRTGEVIEVPDPQYAQNHILNVYVVDTDNSKLEFAAGEFSNGVYGFYIRDKEKTSKNST